MTDPAPLILHDPVERKIIERYRQFTPAARGWTLWLMHQLAEQRWPPVACPHHNQNPSAPA